MMFNPRTRAEFDALVPDEDAAERLLIQLRWPNGVTCQECGSRAMTHLEERKLWQCRPCRKQTSIRSGTIMHGTRFSLRDWLYAIWRACSPGVSARALARELGRRYETVWVILHKIRAALAGRGWPMAGPVLSGTAEIRVPKVAKGDPRARPPVLVGLLLAPDIGARDPLRVEIARNSTQTDAELRDEAHFQHLEPGAEVRVEAGRKAGPTAGGPLGWARYRIVLWLTQWFRGVSRKYLPNYLAQYLYSQNRWHKSKEGGLARWVGRRVLQEPWRPRSQLALIAP